MQIRVPAKRI
uniref:Uncharacterized protein n=1 Tax=Arundo donax TaxID=35708 RepID=A0A0A8Z815_ARUDO